MKVIINVDDFGLTKGLNEAVFELNKLGTVKSTTALVNSKHFSDVKHGIENYPNLGIGIHLALDIFTSETKHPELCHSDGRFYTGKEVDLERDIDYSIIYDEWKAQIEKFILIAGIKPSHLDSHHHVHLRTDVNKQVAIDLGNEYDIPVRGLSTNSSSSKYETHFYDSNVTADKLEEFILNLSKNDCDNSEMMCHPAIVDDELLAITSYNKPRGKELELLKSDRFINFLETQGIQITSYE